jgi:signal transduction histidine kinase
MKRFKEIFDANKNSTDFTDTLVREIVDKRAQQKDDEIKNNMLKSLVLKYAETERKLVELNDLKNKFLGIASHDLRNPIVSIRGFAELILNGAAGTITEDQKEFTGIIHDTAERMLLLLNDLLDISVIESGKFALDLRHGNIKSLVEKIIKLNGIVAEKKSITIHSDLDDVSEFNFDSVRISQVLENLVSNAIKFSPVGGNIYVTLRQDGTERRVGVRDEGPGLSDEDKKKLFTEFQKLSARPTAGEKSTGLGLSIVKKIVDAHGGKIYIGDNPPPGVEFIFTL